MDVYPLNHRGAVLMVILAVFLTACTQNIPGLPLQASDKTEEDMTQSQRELTSSAVVPPIDSAAPNHFETATFGLG